MVNKQVLSVVLFFLFSTGIQAQIVIDKDDFAEANDTIRISTPSNINDFNFQESDTNFLWNFSNLQRSNQRIKEFFSVLRTNIVFSLFFADLPFNPNRANVADEAELSLPAIISSSDAFNFFLLKNSGLQQIGIGLTLAQIPTPVNFSDIDDIYKFPLTYSNTDTGTAAYQFSVPGVANYAYRHTRINVVDGWGVLITPLDTFDVVRVKTTLNIRDSVFITALNFGFGFNRPMETQYKWLTKNKKIPVLQVNTQGILNNEVVSSSFYQDFEPEISTGIFQQTQFTEISIYPNPAQNIIFVNTPENIIWEKAFLMDLSGKMIALTIEQQQAEKTTIKVPQNIASGNYQLLIYNKHQQARQSLYLQLE